ncbi:MAG: hypothetical protein A2806_03330 [Candidatus Terrybacteria bacterium RIFCSPHIGHO2_01_FULL_48_17]|uniref:POTRA domain-containing protein n=1 Tax=Candidatus Terrybacteria bacterium RIFCSPHIGHO2_01_FULL_48_17 TaxID=1802362 RepID=A0A1G2PH18_9BACT|nr:MAG: hypothetical protein A2806_03330 [Candidatus Terrybacteria bacterium RIFCSPHIGHO2_01_FULL_48_17]OHA53139.1 MAG: hypothetical protein A3A30_02130 [Candidatus Terrybacteria bacterium RIFCSPLOWO2_01_FULL_48_14]
MGTIRYRKARRKNKSFVFPQKLKIPPRIILGGIFIIALFGGVWYVIGPMGLLNVKHVRFEGADRVSPDAMQQVIVDHFSGKRFGVAQMSMVFLRPADIRAVLVQEFPRLQEVNIRYTLRPFGFFVHIQERTLAALWCVGKEFEQGTIDTQQCFAADRYGVLFDEAPKSEGALVISIIDTTRADAHLGESVFSEEELGALSEVRDILKNIAGVLVVRIIRAGEHEFRAETAQRWFVIIDPAGDLAAQASALREVLAQVISPEERLALEYIDVRTPGKVFYK